MEEAAAIWLMGGSLVLSVVASRLIVKAFVDKKRRGFWLGWVLFSISLGLILFAVYQ